MPLHPDLTHPLQFSLEIPKPLAQAIRHNDNSLDRSDNGMFLSNLVGLCIFVLRRANEQLTTKRIWDTSEKLINGEEFLGLSSEQNQFLIALHSMPKEWAMMCFVPAIPALETAFENIYDSYDL